MDRLIPSPTPDHEKTIDFVFFQTASRLIEIPTLEGVSVTAQFSPSQARPTRHTHPAQLLNLALLEPSKSALHPKNLVTSLHQKTNGSSHCHVHSRSRTSTVNNGYPLGVLSHSRHLGTSLDQSLHNLEDFVERAAPHFHSSDFVAQGDTSTDRLGSLNGACQRFDLGPPAH